MVSCRSYRPGHNVHPRRPHPPGGSGAVTGRLLVDDDDVLLATDDDLLVLRSHDRAGLRRLAERYAFLRWEVAGGLLLPAHRDGLATYPVASVVAEGEDLEPCAA